MPLGPGIRLIELDAATIGPWLRRSAARHDRWRSTAPALTAGSASSPTSTPRAT
jgi:hypothetical protein